MISFELTEEQIAIRDMLSNYARDELAPQAREIDEAGTIPDSVLQAGWELGIIASAVPEAIGGGGERSALTNVLALEALGYGCASLTTAIMAPNLFCCAVIDYGTPEQQAALLPPFTQHEFYSATLALHESSFSFSPNTLNTIATKTGTQWCINGGKRMVPLAQTANYLLVISRCSEGSGTNSLGAFIVPNDAAGLAVRAESGQMGLKPVPMSIVEFDNVKLPLDAQLSGCDIGRLLSSLRVGAAAVALGVARAATEYAIPYAKERVAFGEAIGKKQAIAFMLADMYSNCESLRWLIWKAANQLDQGADATKASVLAHNYAQRYALKTTDDALQVFGGHGFIRDFPLEMWLRNVRTLTVHDAIAAA